MTDIEIKYITDKDKILYKNFFMKGLIQDSNNFRISPQDEINADFPTNGTTDSFTLGAYATSELAGVVSFERDGQNREKLRHKGILFRMYISPDFRGKGISKILINKLLELVNKVEDIEQINLTVISNNTVAKKIYESFGFKTFSMEMNAQKWKGVYFDEETMVLPLCSLS